MKEHLANFLKYWKEGVALAAAPALVGVILCQEKRIKTLKTKLKFEQAQREFYEVSTEFFKIEADGLAKELEELNEANSKKKKS